MMVSVLCASWIACVSAQIDAPGEDSAVMPVADSWKEGKRKKKRKDESERTKAIGPRRDCMHARFVFVSSSSQMGRQGCRRYMDTHLL
jgi:hypothetical protein